MSIITKWWALTPSIGKAPCTFGDLMNYGNAPHNCPMGIGGDDNVIWHSDVSSDLIHELSTSDFSSIRSDSSPWSLPYGIGGDSSTIWHCNGGASHFIAEISTTDLSLIRNGWSPSTSPRGIGGDSTTIWHSNLVPNKYYELSTTDFSVIRNAVASQNPQGIGGDSGKIWECEETNHRISELSITDFTVIKYVSAPSPLLEDSHGIGGSSTSHIWYCGTGVGAHLVCDICP